MGKPTLSEVISAASKAGKDTQSLDEYLKIKFSGTYVQYEMEFPKGLDTMDRYDKELYRWACIPGEIIELASEEDSDINNDREYRFTGIFNYSKEMLPIIVCIEWIEMDVLIYRPITMSPKQFTTLIKESNAFDVENNRIYVNNLSWTIRE